MYTNTMRILIASTNSAKVARVRKLTRHLDVEWITPSDLGLAVTEVEEGSDVEENAKQKCAAYREKTDLPILANDTAFVIPAEPDLDPAKVRRNTLAGKDERLLSRDEVAQIYTSFYKNLAAKHGGRLPAYWLDVYALSPPDGDVIIESGRRDVILTNTIHYPVDPGFPMRFLYIVVASGKYCADQTEEDEEFEMESLREALEKLIVKAR